MAHRNTITTTTDTYTQKKPGALQWFSPESMFIAKMDIQAVKKVPMASSDFRATRSLSRLYSWAFRRKVDWRGVRTNAEINNK